MWLKSVDTPTPVTYPLSQKKPGVVLLAMLWSPSLSSMSSGKIFHKTTSTTSSVKLPWPRAKRSCHKSCLCHCYHHHSWHLACPKGPWGCHPCCHRRSYHSHHIHHLLSEIPSGQEHHEVRPRNLAEALWVILVEQGAPPIDDKLIFLSNKM